MALMQINPDNKIEGEIILKYIKNLIDANRTALITVVGPVGKGKSWSCLRWGELWYKYYFNKPFPKENICFSIEHLLQRLNDIDDKKLTRAELLVLEEAGINVGNKKFMCKINIAMNYVTQSFRSLNIIVLINVPFVNFIDKSVRMLQTAIFEIDNVDKSKGLTYVKPYFVQTNQWSGKMYKKWLRIKDVRTGKTIKIKRVCISRPSKELIDIYEPMKEKFVRDTISKGLNDIQNDRTKPIKQLKELTDRQQAVYNQLMKGISSTGEIAKILGIGADRVSLAKQGIRNKGYSLTNQAKMGEGSVFE